MAGVEEIARRFSLAGVLDDDARARERYPISEIEVADIADHPGNAAYSMDEGPYAPSPSPYGGTGSPTSPSSAGSTTVRSR